MAFLQQLIKSNLSDSGACCPSICSAQPDVLAASFILAKEKGNKLIVEATSNQVNQFGGYTGMKPADFINNVHQIADSVGYPRDFITFGGDHLGPQVWRVNAADVAMSHAETMMKEYVQAGFCKIHLDCSEGCEGEAQQVSDELSAERAAALAKICYENAPDPEMLSFVVGTEVPPPGGARPEHEHGVIPTTGDAAKKTLDAQRQAFDAINPKLWGHVVALVVQPGVEFSPDTIDHLDIDSPDPLSEILPHYPNICFEAHSTDYQFDSVFEELGRRHFAILKVGPALTFAFRKAIYKLSDIDQWLNGNAHISELIDERMIANPKYWQGHYEGSDEELKNLRHFSYADRIRYYWTDPEIAAEVIAMKERLSAVSISDYMLDSFFTPTLITRINSSREQDINWVQSIIYAEIQEMLEPYFVSEEV